MALYVVLLGPPGAGKGTQAAIMSEMTGLRHISSGVIFREHITNQTELGKLARKYIAQGELVPDDVTNAMIRQALAAAPATGAVLDGFPRTLAQARALDEMLAGQGESVGIVLHIEVPEEELIRRLSGRWMCRAHDHVYHVVFHPPRVEGVCDVDGSELYQREDDRPETVRERIRVYRERTTPLLEYYAQRGLLVEICGDQPIEAVTKDLLAALETR
jgi:adenylate kinase